MPREQRVGGLDPAVEARFGTMNLFVYPVVYTQPSGLPFDGRSFGLLA